ncbi:peptidoglycan bridge formation glycyltransferase FemA/FemB family protein [Patescibacteria group bacterium]|nr:peptidoglycan bridge formation glycyltransferase FemA/FemB family protein [Patescibacteria group bacterium]
MEIREITEKHIWEEFLSKCQIKTFLQSWSWGEFSKAMGEKIWRFGIYGKAELVSVALVEKKVARRGTFLVIPHGPITVSRITYPVSSVLRTLVERLKEVAKEEKASFIRVNSLWERNEENKAIFRNLGFRQAPIQTHPESSWKLDITLPEDELLIRMRKTTRYLIKQTFKNPDLKVTQSTEIADVKLFSELHERVSRRQNFVPFSVEYLEKEFQIFVQDEGALLFFVRYKGKVVAASFIIFWSGIGFYHHAASLPQFTKLSAPYRLQWEAIREAKRRGCELYDFWGFVDPKKQPNHPWAGPTLFKMGFGGKASEYVKTQDLPLDWGYWPTAIFEIARRIRRRL